MKPYPLNKIRKTIEASIQKDDVTGCWNWRKSCYRNGYGLLRSALLKETYAHRVSYRVFVGEFDLSLDLDHVCRNRGCVNPAHLEPVTRQVNLLRGETIPAKFAARTHCNNGHPLAGDNLCIKAEGGRSCRTCRQIRQMEKYRASVEATGRTVKVGNFAKTSIRFKYQIVD